MATIIRLKNLTPLHIGTGKENYDFSAALLQSDTISAALASVRAQMGKKNDIHGFMESFTVSSAFPYSGNRLFLPKPIGKLAVSVSEADEYPSRKKLKKIRWIEFDLWKQLMNGNTLVVSSNQLNGDFLLSADNKLPFANPFKSQVNQRVSVPRDDNSKTEPFFFDWTYFNENSGLYCLLDAPKNVEEEILDLFKKLGEYGIGTDKNIGGGKFEVDDSQKIVFDSKENANALMLLSLFIPTKDEIDTLHLEKASYELVLRGGYMAGSEEDEFKHLRKKSIYAFSIGSLFPISAKLGGKVVDLRPDWNDERMHPVFRSGKPFVVPVKLKDYE